MLAASSWPRDSLPLVLTHCSGRIGLNMRVLAASSWPRDSLPLVLMFQCVEFNFVFSLMVHRYYHGDAYIFVVLGIYVRMFDVTYTY